MQVIEALEERRGVARGLANVAAAGLVQLHHDADALLPLGVGRLVRHRLAELDQQNCGAAPAANRR
jgi:hypothetical protein